MCTNSQTREGNPKTWENKILERVPLKNRVGGVDFWVWILIGGEEWLYLRVMDFKLTSKYLPTGDQPEAIEELSRGVLSGQPYQTLLGVTGSGKTGSLGVNRNFFCK